MSIPTTERAIIIKGPKEAELVYDHPVPKVRLGYILVKNVAVALNPTDWKHIDSDALASPGAIVGCDFAGTVVAIGDGVKKDLKLGERITSFSHGSSHLDHEKGAFCDYVLVPGDNVARIPDSLSFEDASTLSVGLITVGQAMYQSLKLPEPGSADPGEKKSVLIYGGSTATGTIAIQFAKLSGLHVITVCSSSNFPLVKSRGADETYDYKSPDVGKKIRADTNNTLQYCLDTVNEPQTAAICGDALSDKLPAYFTGLTRTPAPREDLALNASTMAYTSLGEEIQFGPNGPKVPALPEHKKFAEHWYDLSEKLLAEGKLKGHPADIRPGGLKGVLSGLDDLKNGKVSGKKLVYRVSETPAK